MSTTWGRPARDPGDGWVVVDVETSGFRPGQARVLSVAALALDALIKWIGVLLVPWKGKA